MDLQPISNSFPGFDKIYGLSSAIDSHDKFFAKAITDNGDPIKDLDILTGNLLPPPPIISLHYGEGEPIPGDILWTTELYLGPIISQKVLDLFQSVGVTGIRPFPIDVYDKFNQLYKDYYGLSVIGRCGPIDFSNARLISLPPPTERGKATDHYLGLFFDPFSWDGSDIFIPKYTAIKLIVEKVATALIDNHITNIKLIKCTDYLTPAFTARLMMKKILREEG